MQRRRQRAPLSMTSLIDVIFLLLLFFMLSSTFSKFGEIPLMTAGQKQSASQNPLAQPIFVRVAQAGVSVNGQPTVLDRLTTTARRLTAEATAPQPFLLSVADDAHAQLLVRAMFQLRRLPNAHIVVVH